jgi:hypothetical protein
MKNNCRPSTFEISTQQHKKWEVECVLVAQILPPTNVPIPSYGQMYHIISSPIENRKQYEIMINNFPAFICIDFVLIGSLGGYGKWVHYKYLYYILQIVRLCGLMEMFIHHPT